MTLAFYKVNNSQDFGRHEFDSIYDDRQAIIDKLGKLSDEELMCYDVSSFGTLSEFACDYNDELLDGGWWCVVIP